MPKEGVELMPEPEDRAILTAVDKGAEGYSGEDYGLSDKEARDLRGHYTVSRHSYGPTERLEELLASS